MRKIAIYSVITIILALIATRPFNYFCKVSGKCQAIVLSYYLPTFAGDEKVDVEIQALNHFRDLDFEVETKNISTFTGKNVKVDFVIKNRTDSDIKIQKMFFIDPDYAEEYLKRFECLCFNRYFIAKNSEIELSAKFQITKDIEQDQNFIKNKKIVIGYEIVDIFVVND